MNGKPDLCLYIVSGWLTASFSGQITPGFPNIKEVPVSDKKTSNLHMQVIMQKLKKNRIGVDLLCIIIELYSIP